MPINLYPDFKFFLAPANKTGKLAFVEVTGPANAPEVGRVLEADFSRPNVGGTSGSSVWRNNQLIELAENEPDWDDKDGCPVIKMRTQAANLVTSPSGSTLFFGTETNVTALNPYGVSESIFQMTQTAASARKRFLTFGSTVDFTQNTDYSFHFWVKQTGGSAASITPRVGAQRPEMYNLALNEWTLVELNINSSTETSFEDTGIDINSVSNDAVLLISEIQIVKGSGLFDFIPHGITRSANQFEFTDLVSKGVNNSANQFSILLEIGDYSISSATGIVSFGYDGSDIVQLAYVARSQGLTIWRIYNTPLSTTDVSTIKPDEPVIIILNGTSYKMVKANGDTFELEATTYTSPINKLGSFTFGGNLAGYSLKRLGFSPIALTEAQAISALNSL